MPGPHHYKSATLAMLYMYSRARCMDPGCETMLIIPLDSNEQSTSEGNTLIIKNIAHIHSPRPNGPRYISGMSIDELRGYENLLLLCPVCHKKIDDFPDRYPHETLRHWRNLSEMKTVDALVKKPSLLSTVINAISKEESFSMDASYATLNSFEIEKKISHNDLKEYGYVVRERAVFQAVLLPLYRAIEQQGS
ncbi:MAG: hypothetical protein FWD93_05950, partial [Coriobacteriia bacterium]|nr:hypothetical protein [Coriobacteriia bacterium]